MFDFARLEHAAVNQVVRWVGEVSNSNPNEHVYGAIFHGFYGEGRSIRWPDLTVGTDESLARAAESTGEDASDLRWSGSQLEHTREPGQPEADWVKSVTDHALKLGAFAARKHVYDEFVRTFARAALRARSELVKLATVDNAMIVVAVDDSGQIIQVNLSAAKLGQYFVEYDAAHQERQRLNALEPAARVEVCLPHALGMTDSSTLPVDEYESMIREAGAAGVPTLVRALTAGPRNARWKVAMLLAEINLATPAVVNALSATLDDRKADPSTRGWAGAALMRLDQAHIVSGRLGAIHDRVAAAALAAPYRALRERGKFRPLNYAPLEQALRSHPHLEPAIARELTLNRGALTLTAPEHPEAQRGLLSEFAVIRDHAATVLRAAQTAAG